VLRRVVRPGLAGDFWGGFAAMLVALPSAIAFGVTIFAPMGGSYAAQGALAGILGTAAIGIVAASMGGTKRLISAPCAPAAAVLSALTIELVAKATPPAQIVLMLAGVALLCGVFQMFFGLVRLGTLIKYMPYPVVSGYLSGVGLIIIISQVPKFLGVPTSFWQALSGVGFWRWQNIAVGSVTVAVMVLAPRVTKAVPAAILALAAGVATYFLLGLADRSLLTLAGNKLVIGSLGASGAGFFDSIALRWRAVGGMNLHQVALLVVPALTLAVLLSIDTLKTCVVLDSLTRSRHDSNRELIGQGLGNLASTAVGGVPGAGAMGVTLVNMSSGGQTRLSGVIEGALALVTLLILGPLIAWVPIAALAGILIVVGVRMFDRKSLHLLRSRSTILDFAVIVAVVIVAETVGLIPASAVGLGLAVMLFMRAQIGGHVVRRKTYGSEMFSKQVRLPEEMAVLEQRGIQTVIFELQGSLFFGTADQLYTALEPELTTRKYIILDMRRVQSVDVTAAHMLENVERVLHERGGFLIFSHLPVSVPTGQDMEHYFDRVGLVQPDHHVLTFGHRDEALEWVEDDILAEAGALRHDEQPLDPHEIELFKGRKEETLAALVAFMETRSYRTGETIFQRGSVGDELFLIRRGTVRIMLPLHGRSPHHLATFRRGDFFGEMSFLDPAPRSADAVAVSATEVFVLSRARFDQLAVEHKRLAADLLEGLAKALAMRLRHTDREIYVLQDS
jgi:sulfate permease, SulP family